MGNNKSESFVFCRDKWDYLCFLSSRLWAAVAKKDTFYQTNELAERTQCVLTVFSITFGEEKEEFHLFSVSAGI